MEHRAFLDLRRQGFYIKDQIYNQNIFEMRYITTNRPVNLRSDAENLKKAYILIQKNNETLINQKIIILSKICWSVSLLFGLVFLLLFGENY